MKRGRKTVRVGAPSASPGGSSRSTSRGSQVYKHTGVVNAPMGERLEAFGMQRAEEEQCSYSDNFWGIDKESNDRARDRADMHREFELSSDHEQHCKIVQLQQEWERQYQHTQHEEAYAQALKEMQTRRYYMRTLFATGSSEDVMKFVWNPETRVQPKPGASLPTAGTHHGGSRTVLDDSTASMSGFESLQRLLGGPAFELPVVDQEYRPSLHLDGLQQARALAQGEAQTLGASLRNRSSTAGIAEAAMSSTRKSQSKSRGGTGGGGGGKKGSGAGGQFVGAGAYVTPVDDVTTGKRTYKLTMSNGNSAMLPPPAGRKHVEALDGHVQLGWDQEALLAASFALLDSRGVGYLTLEDVAAMAKSHEVRALLRFTVLGSFLKRRDWDHFQSRLFDNSDASIGIDEWLALASGAASEDKVPLRYVRSDEEHSRIVKAAQSLPGELGWQTLVASTSNGVAKKSGWFADQARDHLSRGEREASLARQLQRGDVVWALHGRGVVWLQAVVEALHVDGTCDLSYPLSTTAVARQREAQVTNRLINSTLNLNSQQSLSTIANIDELSFCGKIFDVLSGRSESIHCAQLIAGFFLSNVRPFVASSSVLSIIAPPLESIDAAAATEENKSDASLTALPFLCRTLLELYPGDVTRSNFIFFCELVRERRIFSFRLL